MNVGLRRALMMAAALAAAAAGGGLWALRAGRPLFYTDGEHEVAGRELAQAPMVVLGAPEPVAEVPGPVQGRVQTLPDGRLLYGRVDPSGSTDLVVFDPRHADLSPELALELNSPAHEFAPTLAADGWVYFCSDRPGGAGGFDLYRAPWQGRAAGAVERISALINTELDECDPAPSPDGMRLIFVRRNPALGDRRNGALHVAALSGDHAAVPLYAPGEANVPVERDPAWSPDSASLWFVREAAGSATSVVVRAVRLGDVFSPPLAVPELGAHHSLRSPSPSADGLALHLLDPGRAGSSDKALLYRVAAHAVYPWWAGQAGLELLLLSLLIIALLLLLLLWLGARWRHLDVVTWCLLLSALVHLLLLLWFSELQLVSRFFSPSLQEGGIEVQLVASAAGSVGDPLQVAPASDAAHGELRFAGHQQELTAAAPASAAAAAEREHAEPARRGDQPLPDTSDSEPLAALRDAPAIATPLQGADRQRLVAATASKVEATAVAVAAERAATDERALAAAAPVAAPSVAPHDRDAQLHSDLPPITSAAATQSVRATMPSVADAAVAIPLRSGAEPQSTPRAAAASQAPENAVAVASPSRAAESPRADALRVEGPAAADAVGRAGHVEPAPEVATTPRPQAVARAEQPGLRDDAEVAARAAPDPSAAPLMAAPATFELAKSATAAAPQLSQANDTAIGAATAAPPLAQLARARAAAAPADRPAPTLPAAALPPSVELAERLPSSAMAAAREPTSTDAAQPVVADGPAVEPSAAPALTATRVASPIGVAAASAPMPTTALERGPVATSQRMAHAEPKARERVLPDLALRDGAPPQRMPSAAVVPAGAVASLVAAATNPEPQTPTSWSPVRSADDSGTGAPARGSLPTPGSALQRARATDAQGAATAMLPQQVRAPAAAVALRDGAGAVESPATMVVAGTVALRPMSDVSQPRAAAAFAAIAPTSLEATARAGSLRLPGSWLERAPRATAGVDSRPEQSPSLYINRFGPSKTVALERFGGSAETERAVRMGLRYLASIQNEDGSWGPRGFRHEKYGEVCVGKTGLCTLAFLGAGHVPGTDAEYAGVVGRAIAFLCRVQDPDSGAFGHTSSYSHGIATYALAECAAIGKDARLQPAIEAGVQWIRANQNRTRDKRNEGGWGYFSDTLSPEDHFSRNSITAWMVMALESARLSGIDVAPRVMDATRRYLWNSFNAEQGWFYYNQNPSRLQSEWPSLPASTPASVLALLLLGEDRRDWRIRAALDYTVERRPRRYARPSDDDFVRRARGNVYFWYCGSLACFLAGGEVWQTWNEALKKVLPAAQEDDGSWAPIDPYAEIARDQDGDRSYTTAMCVLSLEVYYRYLTPLLDDKGGRR